MSTLCNPTETPLYLNKGYTALAEGNTNLTGFKNRMLIKWARVSTASTNWDMTLYTKDDFVTDAFQIVNDRSGNYNIYLDYPYRDEDGTSELHYTFTSASGAETHDLTIYAYELR